ncbi:MAG TPA: hypothetical protein VGC42_30695 [Kofleriaceae bacterium]
MRAVTVLVTLGLVALGLVALGLVAGCGHTVREVVRDGIDEVHKDDNLKKLTGAAHDLASAVTTGLIDGLPPDQVPSRLAPLIDNLVRVTLRAAAAGLDAELSPAVARAVRSSVDAALASILSDRTQHDLVELESTVIAAAMRGLSRGIRDELGPSIAGQLEKSLGPALQRAVLDRLGPSIAAALDANLQPLHDAAASAGAGLVDGINAKAQPALDEALAKIRAELGTAKQDVYSIFELVLFVVLALAVGVLLVIAVLRHRAAVNATDALQLVTSQIGQMRQEPSVQALAGKIKHAGDGTRAGTYLSAHLRAHPASKISAR